MTPVITWPAATGNTADSPADSGLPAASWAMTSAPQHYVSDLIRVWARAPARPALSTPQGMLCARDLTAWLATSADRLAERLPAPGDGPIALFFSPNSPAWLIARYAAHLHGRSVVHIRSENARSDDTALDLSAQLRILHETSCQLLLVDRDGRTLAHRLRRDRPGLAVLELPPAPHSGSEGTSRPA
ncbi:MAG: hypothetical protein ACRC0L_07960, partial [Angustibacter sp.]